MNAKPAPSDAHLHAPHACSSLARLQQLLAFSAFGLALAWGMAVWAASPLLALGGAALLLLGYALVLALEFVTVARVNRGDSVPAANAATLLRAWWQEVRVAPVVFAWRQPFRWQTWPDASERNADPAKPPAVVFVHGFVCNRGFWLPWMRTLRALGVPYTSVNLEPVFGSIPAYVPLIEEAVRRAEALSGQPPVLICHSMGGLAARAWWSSTPDAAQRVQRVITIGTPHHGTWLGQFSHVPNGQQMRRNHAWLANLAEREKAGSDAPYERFTCWYSNADNIVFPASTALLEGADNRHVPGVAHVALGFHPRVMRESLAMVASAARSPAERTAA
ncbi:alpha/beta fold hydrolase [Hydrogenophaga sp.]|uniref:esterase/lipase family protein n=1 Tax=Hydrogenophaga sp. TaxID=1904254 RepID=UPI00260E1872|nr:alpha/beta fold hydrolase [Hydrogenophaga sp.]MDM7951044.1 permease [Hydrogenophaga sp.]